MLIIQWSCYFFNICFFKWSVYMVIGADVYVMAKKTYSVPTRDPTGVLFPGVSDILNGNSIQKSGEMRLTKIQSECG